MPAPDQPEPKPNSSNLSPSPPQPAGSVAGKVPPLPPSGPATPPSQEEAFKSFKEDIPQPPPPPSRATIPGPSPVLEVPLSEEEYKKQITGGAAPSAMPPSSPAQPSDVKKSPFRFLLPIFAAIILIALLNFVFFKFLLPLIKTRGSLAVEINYWGLWEPSAIIQPVFDEFENQNPNLKVNYTQKPIKDYRELLQSKLAQGEGPDLFRFHNSWLPMFKDELAPVPSSVFSSNEYQTLFYPATEALKSGNQYLGVPLMYEGLSLFYNKRIFQQAGKAPPTSWFDLRKTAFDLTIRDAQGNLQTSGVALGSANNVDHWPEILTLLMLQNGADLNNLSSPPSAKLAAEALEYYTIFTRTDKVWNDTLPNSTYAFATEKTAMYFGPSWRIFELLQINSELNFGIIPVPQLIPERPDTYLSLSSYWAEGVSQKSANQEAAFKLLKFLTQQETLEKFYQNAVQAGRLFGEIYPRTDLADKIKDDPYVSPFITQAPYAQTWYLNDRTFDNGINDRLIKYFADAINSVNQGAGPDQALVTATEGVDQILIQYGLKAAPPTAP